MLRKIQNLRELSEFAPQLLDLHETLDGKWEPESSREEFAAQLLEHFGDSSHYFGDFDPLTGKISYFAAILPQDKERCFFWLFYMNKDFRSVTRSVIDEIFAFLKSQGFSSFYTQSARLSSSYERWIEKLGGKKLAITYKFELK